MAPTVALAGSPACSPLPGWLSAVCLPAGPWLVPAQLLPADPPGHELAISWAASSALKNTL